VNADASRDFLHGQTEPFETVNGLQRLEGCLRTLTFHPARLQLPVSTDHAIRVRFRQGLELHACDSSRDSGHVAEPANPEHAQAFVVLVERFPDSFIVVRGSHGMRP